MKSEKVSRFLNIIGLGFAFLLLACSESAASTKRIKVACVGNSITYGAGVSNPDKNSYPAQLGYMLGEEYEVRNFGVSGATMLRKGDYPYDFRPSLEYNPDIVLIKLGTNDSKTHNRDKLGSDFKSNYQAVIDAYKSLPSNPRIILMNPVPCYITEGMFGGANEIYKSQIIPVIESLAYENSLEIIDLFHAFDDKWDEPLMPDKLHPSSLGQTVIAQRIAPVITRQASSYKINVESTAKFNFHGYEGFEIGANKVVVPKNTAQGNPWIIRARFWGHEPQTDIALLENGFHLAYCDVADLYGSPEALKRYDAFYKDMTSKGLSKKVVLEGMSRGGLIVFNWAAVNPEKVAAIYADAPVLDFKSWPMGLGEGPGSKEDTERLLKVYGFKDMEAAKKWKKNPIDQTKAISTIPTILVVGDADEVVPVSENSNIFEQKIPNITVIHKPGVKHHPHSLFNPTPIVNFILRATGQWQNPCVKPVPGSEFRSGAGWVEGSDWHKISEEITSVLEARKVDVLLIGNSITQGFAGTRKLVTWGGGKAAMDAVCSSWESAGISGDRTQHVLWRLKNGNYNAAQPKKVFITIGVNNLVSGGDSAEDVAEGIKAVAAEAAIQFPNSEIIVFGLLPVGLNPDDAVRLKHDKVHEVLKKAAFPKNVVYKNLAPQFTIEDGKLNTELYGGDYLHLSGKGYEFWTKIIAQYL